MYTLKRILVHVEMNVKIKNALAERHSSRQMSTSTIFSFDIKHSWAIHSWGKHVYDYKLNSNMLLKDARTRAFVSA